MGTSASSAEGELLEVESAFGRASIVTTQRDECGGVVALGASLMLAHASCGSVANAAATGGSRPQSSGTIYCASRALLRLGNRPACTCAAAVVVASSGAGGGGVRVAVGGADGRVRTIDFLAHTLQRAQMKLGDMTISSAHQPVVDTHLPMHFHVSHSATSRAAPPASSSASTKKGKHRASMHALAVITRSATTVPRKGPTILGIAVDGTVHAWRRKHAKWRLAYKDKIGYSSKHNAATAVKSSRGRKSPRTFTLASMARRKRSDNRSERSGFAVLSVSERTEHDRNSALWTELKKTRPIKTVPTPRSGSSVSHQTTRCAEAEGSYPRWEQHVFPRRGLTETTLVVYDVGGRAATLRLDAVRVAHSFRASSHRTVLAMAVCELVYDGTGDPNIAAVLACAHADGAISRWRISRVHLRREASESSSARVSSFVLAPCSAEDLEGHVGDVRAVRFIDRATNTLLVSGGDDGMLRVWHFELGVMVHSIAGLWCAAITSIDCFEDGSASVLFVASEEGCVVKLWAGDDDDDDSIAPSSDGWFVPSTDAIVVATSAWRGRRCWAAAQMAAFIITLTRLKSAAFVVTCVQKFAKRRGSGEFFDITTVAPNRDAWHTIAKLVCLDSTVGAVKESLLGQPTLKCNGVELLNEAEHLFELSSLHENVTLWSIAAASETLRHVASFL